MAGAIPDRMPCQEPNDERDVRNVTLAARHALYRAALVHSDGDRYLTGIFAGLLALGWTADEISKDVEPLLVEVRDDPERESEYNRLVDNLDPLYGWVGLPDLRLDLPVATTTALELSPLALGELVARTLRRTDLALSGALRLLVAEGADPAVLRERLASIAAALDADERADDVDRLQRITAQSL